MDKIVQFMTILQKNDFIYCVAIRESNCFDLYYNATRVYDSGETKIMTADMSFDTIYLLLNRQDERQIEMKHKTRISLENSEVT